MFVILCGCVLPVLVLLLIHLVFNYNEKARLIRKIPGPKDMFIIGNALEILRSRTDLFERKRNLANTYNDIYRFYVYSMAAVFIYNPDDIEKIISVTKHKEKKSAAYWFLKPWLGDGLILSNGTKWKQRRKIMNPGFRSSMLNKFTQIFYENSRRITEHLEKTAGEAVELFPIVSEFALNAICETTMGTKLSEENALFAKSYKRAICELKQVLFERLKRFYLYFDCLYKLSSLYKHESHLLNVIDNFTTRIIENRIASNNSEHNAPHSSEENLDEAVAEESKRWKSTIDILLESEKQGLIDREEVKEEINTLVFAGHDTSESGLICCFVLFADNKLIQDKIFIEQQNIFGDSLRAITAKDLSQMNYLDCCIKEAMRLYPPAPSFGRELDQTVTLSNYTVPAGTNCFIEIFDLHRSDKIYKDPLKYDPDRFLPENCIGRHPYAYIPFSAGPRNCIGQKFAMLELKTVLSAVLREFEVIPVTRPADLKFTSDLVLQCSSPVYLKFHKRKLLSQ